jgi:hypothetical protein
MSVPKRGPKVALGGLVSTGERTDDVKIMSERSYSFLRRVESNRLTYDFAVGKNSNGKIGPESSQGGVVTTALEIYSIFAFGRRVVELALRL